MYNEERKRRYIEYKESNTVSAENFLFRLFRSLGEYEEKYGKDCCDFVEDEIINFYKMLGTRSVDIIVNNNSRLALYTDWCMAQGFVADGQNHYRALTRKNFESCVNTLAIQAVIFTRDEWLDMIRNVQNPRDQFILLYIYEVGVKDIADILTDMEVNWFFGNTLHLPGRDVLVSDELVAYARMADAEEYYYTKDNKRWEMEDTGKVIKWRRNKRNSEAVSPSTLHILMIKLMKELDLPTIRPKEIAIMGQIHMLQKLSAESGLEIEKVIWTQELYSQVKNQYAINSPSGPYWRKIKGYLG